MAEEKQRAAGFASLWAACGSLGPGGGVLGFAVRLLQRAGNSLGIVKVQLPVWRSHLSGDLQWPQLVETLVLWFSVCGLQPLWVDPFTGVT